MKYVVAVLSIILCLSGCASQNGEMDRAMALRAKLLAQSCEFTAQIAADYGDKVYQFEVACKMDNQGTLEFQVVTPESISGIGGSISSQGGKLTFDDEGLSFPLLAQGQITPVSAPWVLMHTLRSGYLTSCGTDGGVIRLAIDDSYADNALHLDIWLDGEDLPQRGEILWQGRRILSITLKDFAFL